MLGRKRPLATFDSEWPIVQGALRRKGLRKVEDLEGVTAEDLTTKDYKPTQQDVENILKLLEADKLESSPRAYLPISAAQMYQTSRATPKIITFCKALDGMMGGGITRGQLTEICGIPGSGKTQIAMQLIVDVQIPQSFKGTGGKAVYIDTEGSFMASRVAEMGKALLVHLHKIMKGKTNNIEQQRDAANLNLDSLLNNIFVFRVLDDQELLDTFHHLPAFLDQHPEVALVVIDSIAFPFRQDLVFQTETAVNKARMVNIMARGLCHMASRRNLSIVLTNQMTTKVDGDLTASILPEDRSAGRGGSMFGGQAPLLVPTLGDSWAPAAAVRVCLWTSPQGVRYATLVKSPSQPRQTMPFRINHMGIRDEVASSRTSM